jgi:hypothetical protein
VLMLALNVLHAQAALQCQQVLTPELQQSALARSKLPVADKIVCPTCGPGDREISSKVSKSKTAHWGSKIHRECWHARQETWKKAFSEWAPPCPANVDSASNALPAAAPAVKTAAKSSRGGKKRKADEDLDNGTLGSSVSAVAVSAPSRDFKAIRKRQKLVVQSALASIADIQPQANDTVVADRNTPDDDGEDEDFLEDAFDEVSTVQADHDAPDVDDDNDDDDDDDFLEGQIEEVSASDLGQFSRASTETLVSTQDQDVKTSADGYAYFVTPSEPLSNRALQRVKARDRREGRRGRGGFASSDQRRDCRRRGRHRR